MKSFLFILLLVFANICLGQKDSIAPKKIIYGFKAGGLIDDGEQGPGGYIHFTMEKGQSYFSAGPLFSQKKKVVGRSDGDDIPFYYNNYGLTGFNAVYQISPIPKSRVFQSYFQNELLFHYFMDNGTTGNPNDGGDYLTTAIPYKSHQMVIEDFFGWGFKVKFLKNFYLNQSISLGLAYYSTVQNYNDINYNSTGHNFFPAFLAEIGLGYKFEYKLKLPAISFKQKNPILSYSAFSIDQLDSISAISFKWKNPSTSKKKPSPHIAKKSIDSIAVKYPNVPKDSIVPQKPLLGINVGAMPSYYFEGLDYYANFSIEKGKNFLSFGPIIGLKLELKNEYEGQIKEQYGLTGFYLIYQSKIMPKGKKIDFYIQNEFILHYYTDNGTELYWGNNSFPNPTSKSYNAHASDIEYYLGYGCKIRFLKNFYFDQSFGIGIRYCSAASHYGDNTYNWSAVRIMPSASLKMGIGYTFKNKSKPNAPPSKL